MEIYEVGPRDGLQNEAAVVPSATKVELVRRLARAGLTSIELTSFVAPKWVPQLADAEEVCRAGLELGLGRAPVLVPNLRGLQRALACGAREVAVVLSATESFAQANLNTTLAGQRVMLEPVLRRAQEAQVKVRAYISMSLGDPWEGAVPAAKVGELARWLGDRAQEVVVGDTIGVGTVRGVREAVKAVAAEVGIERVAVHLHDTYRQALVNTLEAIELGVEVVDSAVGGLGGCPYAASASGNLATEELVWMLEGLGVHTGVDLDALVATSRWMEKVLGRPSPSPLVGAWKRREGRTGEDAGGAQGEGKPHEGGPWEP